MAGDLTWSDDRAGMLHRPLPGRTLPVCSQEAQAQAAVSPNLHTDEVQALLNMLPNLRNHTVVSPQAEQHVTCQCCRTPTPWGSWAG